MISRITLLYTCICFLLLIGNGCKNSSETVRKLNLAEKLMNTKPDSSLVILRTLGEDAIPGQKERAKFSLLYSQALDKKAIDIASDSMYPSRVGHIARRILERYLCGQIKNTVICPQANKTTAPFTKSTKNKD